MARSLTDDDRWLFAEGHHDRLYELLGAHRHHESTAFRLWAPNAAWVSVVGEWNGWDEKAHPLQGEEGGMWHGEIEGIEHGAVYKYRIVSRHNYYAVNKADPFGNYSETPPATGSKVWSLDYQWGDEQWMSGRGARQAPDAPISVYEVHLGSWRRQGEVSYRSLAEPLADYCLAHGFTHVELMPVMEHPFYGSWGYQCTGFFAPTARYGTPQDLMFMIDHLHQRGIGVILDWVPSHFPSDEHGLGYFDGTHLFEHADARRGYHPDWNSFIFNYERGEVRSFLLSSGHFWLEKYHADGLRVDAVASMLYLDYSRQEGEWIPNRHGGRENLMAVEFLRRLNGSVHQRFPGAVVIAEESTAWPRVTGPLEEGGLGFNYKWDMGWMNDTLRYVRLDPLFRSHPDTHRLLTFRGLYANSERFMLSLSHDEVVHGKRSLLGKQYGEGWRRFAGLRALFGYLWATPGKKLLFMGGEIAQWEEWNHESELSWGSLQAPEHRGVQQWVTELNRLMMSEPALHREDHLPQGFAWIEADDYSHGVLAFLRRAEGARPVLVLVNFTPVPWDDYVVGVPTAGRWEVLAASDDARYGGLGTWTEHTWSTTDRPNQGYQQSLLLTLPPLSATFLAEAGPP
ncbi:MAG TPA: 1,4-alpha-glucan branching protein GlgB [Acidimicrobiia bacterium]|nr:1,4-alpha-glucan branching protein GlgB [Acidimicrobiia bacterium]